MLKFKLNVNGVRGVVSALICGALVASTPIVASASQKSSLLPLGVSSVTQPGDFPSWEEVQAAKNNVAATQAQVAKIESLISSLREEAAKLGDNAVEKATAQDAAVSAMEESRARLEEAKAKSARAQESADTATSQAGQVAAQLYKTGGLPDGFTLMMSGNAKSTIDKMNFLKTISDRSSNSYAAAIQAKNVSESLTQKAQAAQDEYDRAASDAQAATKIAQDASAAADAKVAAQQEQSNTLLAQLAELRGTSAQLEKDRLDGLAQQAAWEEQQRQAEEAARKKEEEERKQREEDERNRAKKPQPAPQPGPQRPAPPAPQPQPKPQPPAPRPQPPAPKPPAPQPPPPAPAPPPQVVDDPAAAQAYASSRLGAYGWGGDQFGCLVNLWNRESGWRTSADNPYSDAYGIPQALPGSKMATAGADWRTNYRTQINWGLGYIRDRYGSPCAAWAHSEQNNWY